MASIVMWRYWLNGKVFYVANVPGHGGKDWGYTEHVSKAISLSPYWQRRFKADCEHVGSVARSLKDIS